MSTISHTLFKAVRLPVVVSRVKKQLRVQRTFLHQHIDGILQAAAQQNDGSLSAADFEKINNYYGLAVPAILGEAFCAYRGKEMSLQERWTSTCQGAMTGLFDDFFDKDYLPDDMVQQLIMPGGDDLPKGSGQQLFDVFYRKAIAYSSHKQSMQIALQTVYDAQVKSKKQEQATTSETELFAITLYKGGSSLEFYRTAFSPVPTAQESALLYKLGGLMQLANDIFDVYKDREAGIRTLITCSTHIAKTRQLFSDQLNEAYSEARSTGISKTHTRDFLDILSIGIFSRCFVCLDQLERNEKASGNIFNVHSYSRKQLVCDMEKKVNLWRAAKIYCAVLW